jgi:hypothetical protein
MSENDDENEPEPPKPLRICNECCFSTTRIICPRCGGETDIDEVRDVS